MQLIDSSKIIYNYLYQSDKDRIDIMDIINYTKMIESKLNKSSYTVEKVDLKEITSFVNYHSVDMEIENSIIKIKDLNRLKHIIEKYKLNEVDEKIKHLFIKPDNYTFTLLANDNLVLYEILSTNSILKNNKKKFYLANNTDSYLINLEAVMNVQKINNIEIFINKLFTESESIKTNHFNYNAVLKYLENIESLINNYNNISNYLGSLENIKKAKEKSKEILEYIKVANINTTYLSKDSSLYKKISNKHK